MIIQEVWYLDTLLQLIVQLIKNTTGGSPGSTVRWRHAEGAEAAAAGRTSRAVSEVDSEVDSAGASLGRRPAATTATAGLEALRGKKILHISQDFFSSLY